MDTTAKEQNVDENEWVYLHNCTQSDAQSIHDLVDNARKITWRTFRKHVHWTSVNEIFPDYSYRCEHHSVLDGEPTIGFHIKDDWAVSFHKGKYRGVPCYYIQHSGIEWIWTRRED